MAIHKLSSIRWWSVISYTPAALSRREVLIRETWGAVDALEKRKNLCFYQE
jgi:hypothetical protein